MNKNVSDFIVNPKTKLGMLYDYDMQEFMLGRIYHPQEPDVPVYFIATYAVEAFADAMEYLSDTSDGNGKDGYFRTDPQVYDVTEELKDFQ